MTDKGVGALAAALHQSAPELEELDLGGNELTPKARSAPGAASLSPSKSAVGQLGGASGRAKSRLPQFTRGRATLCPRARPQVAPALAQLVAGKKKLCVLRAPDNELGNKGVYAIAEGVFHCPSTQLRELVFDTNEARRRRRSPLPGPRPSAVSICLREGHSRLLPVRPRSLFSR